MTYPFLFCLLGILVSANLRFKDIEQLQAHHQHYSDSNAKITVHLIPHSHDDVGWKKTVDQYFYGFSNDIHWATVQYTIDTFMEELQKDPKRKFIQVETAFFKMWWDLQKEDKKAIARQLVANGQLEFVSGGWCMNDEATPYYEDIIDQMTLGHKFILDNFNVTPTIGWQIDPFGHQNTQAAFSYQMGFDGWFFSRIDYQDKEIRLNNKTMEMIVLPPSVGVQYPLFSHVQYYDYEAPPGFNFDSTQEDTPIVDDPDSYLYNIKGKAQAFVNYFRAQASHYQGNILTHTMGSDFQWTNSYIWYKNLDKLIDYINADPSFNMEFQYSTPSLYLKDINNQGLNYSTKVDDFLPYSDNAHSLWTGYFTSRIAKKGYVKRFGREAQTFRKLFAYQTIKNLTWVVNNDELINKGLQAMDEALGICQHHDAVTGTEKQHVNDDYLRILFNAEAKIRDLASKLLSYLTYNNATYTHYEICNWNMTASLCKNSYSTLNNNKTLIVTLLDGKVAQQGEVDVVRVRVPNLKYLITNQDGKIVQGDVDCSNSNNDCDLFFPYTIPQNNVLVYFQIKPVTTGESAKEIEMKINPFTYTDDTAINFLNSSKSFKLRYGYYESYQGDDQPSGAYIFRTVNASDVKKQYGSIIFTALGYGQVVSVFRVTRSNTKAVIRKFSHQTDTFQIQTFLDQINVADGQGKEIVMIVDTNIANNEFYTDSNGLELQKRILNYRPTWNLKVFEQAAGNYYPVNGVILIKDSNQNTAALLNDRSQGGASLKAGQMELMIHRRILYDDDRGVHEALNEQDLFGTGLTQYVLHTLTFFNMKDQPNSHRKLQYFSDLSPIVFYSTATQVPTIPQGLDWMNVFPGLNITSTSTTEKPLLKVYYQRWNKNEYLLRVQNMQESGNLLIDKTQLKKDCQRTTLTGNQLWADWNKKRLIWKYTNPIGPAPEENDDILYPLQIQAYLVKLLKQEEESII